jgi:hypothetical protein
MVGCLLLVYALICIPVYIMNLMQVFSFAILFNLVLMVLLSGLIIYDLFQDHDPISIIVDRVRDLDPDLDVLGEE